MRFRENETISAIDDSSGALSAIRESILIIAGRHRKRKRLYQEDWDELQRVLDACDRLQEYDLIIRAAESQRHQEGIKASENI